MNVKKQTSCLNILPLFAEDANCRRVALLHYFGEQYTKTECEEHKMCNNCRYPKEKFDCSQQIQVVLKVMQDLKGDFNLEHLVYVLTGDANQTLISYGHDKIKSFGIGQEHDQNYWKSVIRKADVEGIISSNIEQLGTLFITEEGHNYLNDPYPIMVAINENFEETAAEDDDNNLSGSGGGSGYDETLFNMLKEVRKKISKQDNIPPYIVFQDPSLEEMSIKYPITEEELSQIVGVSATKALRYGKLFLELIKKYVEENEIERPDDLVVKSMANKSKLKVSIIQSIDRKINLEDIADSKGLTLEEVIYEIENIVYSGTRININYYIDEILDREYQQEIFDYFRNTESDSIEEALNNFGPGVYSREEIQLMKIRFISEMAN